MNNLIKISILLLSVNALLVTSCSNLTVTKRIHKRGYYVDLGTNKRISKQIEPTYDEVAVINEEVNHPILAVNELNSLVSSDAPTEITSTETRKQTHAEETVQKEKKGSTQTSIFSKAKTTIQITRSNIKETIQHKKAVAKASDGDARSLLWLVIVIVLILWLIGFLAGGLGLGNLINLLLLVALILLILWLLRVI